MKFYSKSIFYLLLFAFSFPVLTAQPVVKTKDGLVKGMTTGSGVHVFKGIPFASPPIGDLRWKAPQPAKKWTGIKDCLAFGPSPMQSTPVPFMFWSKEFLIPETPISEDCLYLNVWSGAKSWNEKRPVLMYIYGGGFRSGGAGCPIYDGENISKKGVVFVSINYRVGIFGFLSHPELSAESTSKTSGNYALLDMIAALKWIRKNIASFGGDPNNVTIAGQSAGSFAVNALTACPLAKGLFHKAIAESGAMMHDNPLRTNMSLKDAEKIGADYAGSMKCNSIKDLRAKTSEEIQKSLGGVSAPIIDGYVLPDKVSSMYTLKKIKPVPALIGWNGDDKVANRAVEDQMFQEQLNKKFGVLAMDIRRAYHIDMNQPTDQAQFDMGRDETFGSQMYAWANIQSSLNPASLFMYNFNRHIPAYSKATEYGAFHSGEIVYAYNNLQTFDRPWTEVDRHIADVMSSYWANFCKTGSPNGKDLPQWKVYDQRNHQVMVIGDDNIRSTELPTLDKMMVWEKYFK